MKSVRIQLYLNNTMFAKLYAKRNVFHAPKTVSAGV